METVKKIVFQAFLVVVALAIGAGLYHFLVPRTPVIAPEFQPVKPIAKVAKVKRTTVPAKKLEVLDKKEVEKKLPLPEEVKASASKQITATAEIPPTETKVQVVAVTDIESGRTDMIARAEPLPLFAFKNDKEVGIRAGIGTQGYTGSAYARWTVARVARVYVALYGEATGNASIQGEAKAMVDISYRW